MKKIILGVVFIFFISFSCKEQVTTPLIDNPPVKTPSIQPDSIAALNLNQIPITLNKFGEISESNWDGNNASISIAGLWLGDDLNGHPKGNLICQFTFPRRGNYTSRLGDKNLGVYSISSSNINSTTLDTLKSYGFPVNTEGKPKFYGDGMLWSSLHSDSSVINQSLILANPIENIRVNQSIFAYSKSDLQNVFFVRYDIKNLGIAPITNLHAGYFADIDLDYASSNSVGYDSIRAFTYTYSAINFVDTTKKLDYRVLGYTFLLSPSTGNTLYGVGSHRIMRKNDLPPVGFGEYGFSSVQQIQYALNGLSNDGNPMINPEINTISKFAYTGDPVTGQGWLDYFLLFGNRVFSDVRSLISSESFSLNPAETKTLIVLWVYDKDPNLKAVVDRIKAKVDLVRSQSNLWNN